MVLWFTRKYKKLISNNDLLTKIKKNFNFNNPNSYNIDILDEMNEIYISPPSDVNNNSDKIFYTEHIDGPYFYIPCASCYRTIIAINENKEITTVFSQITMNTGDLISFDYHRECHYIKKIIIIELFLKFIIVFIIIIKLENF